MTPPNPTAAFITAVAAIAVAVLGGYFGWRNSGRASVSDDQRKWLQTALDEARRAKSDANDAEQTAGRARQVANEATTEAEAAKRQLVALSAQAEDMIGWIGRVVRVAQDVNLNEDADPAVRRLIDVINGGPPTFTADRLNLPKRK